MYMKQILIVCFLSLILVACNSNNRPKAAIEIDKKYLLIEVLSTHDLGVNRTEIDTTEVFEKNDSLAYLHAFEKACISQQASRIIAKELKKVMGAKADYETQYGFMLLGEDAIEIKNVVPDSILSEIERRIFAITTD